MCHGSSNRKRELTMVDECTAHKEEAEGRSKAKAIGSMLDATAKIIMICSKPKS